MHFLDGTSVFNTKKTMEAKVILRGGVAQVYIPCTANIPNLNATILRIQEQVNKEDVNTNLLI
jgi:hypothetical protein